MNNTVEQVAAGVLVFGSIGVSFTAALRFPFFFRVKTVPGRIRHVGGGCDEHELLLQDPHRVGRALLLRPLQGGLA